MALFCLVYMFLRCCLSRILWGTPKIMVTCSITSYCAHFFFGGVGAILAGWLRRLQGIITIIITILITFILMLILLIIVVVIILILVVILILIFSWTVVLDHQPSQQTSFRSPPFPSHTLTGERPLAPCRLRIQGRWKGIRAMARCWVGGDRRCGGSLEPIKSGEVATVTLLWLCQW